MHQVGPVFMTSLYAQVITVPALFSKSQKAATINAAGMAGISDVALIQGGVENISDWTILNIACFMTKLDNIMG